MEGKKLDKILNADELRYLVDLMNHPGWHLLEKVNNAVKEDWIDQTADVDMTTKSDEELVRFIRSRQGQIKGVSLFLKYLEKKKGELQHKN